MKGLMRSWSGDIAVIAIAAIVMIAAGCEGGRGAGTSIANKGLTPSEAGERLEELARGTNWTEDIVVRTKSIDLSASADPARTLPPIEEYPVTVRGDAPANAEICASSEKAGKGSDGWINEVARDFNASKTHTASGTRASVTIRKVASGVCHDYIASGRYVPDGFSPSNVLWVRMVEAKGTAMEPIAERLVGNAAGIVMKETVGEQIKKARGGIGVTQVIESVAAGEIAMGYTNVYASSTGLNFLQTTLATYANGEEQRMLDPDVRSAFETFQLGVPFIALTTIQMRDAVDGANARGVLDAFVMERQTFANSDMAKGGWSFIPFGVRHDNPLYAVQGASATAVEALRAFAKFVLKKEAQTLATRYGFNADEDYAAPYPTPSGKTLIAAQALWKEKKDAGKPILAVFAVDVSGSMGGNSIRQVREALSAGAEFISPTSGVGLVAFSDRVSIRLQPARFNLQHKGRFLAAVEELDDGGGTAMYDAVVVSLRLLREARTGEYANAKLRLIVLSDGETKNGYNLREVEDVVRGLSIPVYTIAYGNNADRTELGKLAALAEAAAIASSEARVAHSIGSLLNAQL